MEHLSISIVLHDIRSVYNVGSIFRTADAAGVSHVYLTGYTPAPIDRFGRIRSDIAKTALGAERAVSWSQHARVEACILELQNAGTCCIAVEQQPNSADYRTVAVRQPTAFIFGNEVEGVPASACNACDYVVEIPHGGVKESLNVSVAVGVVLFQSIPS